MKMNIMKYLTNEYRTFDSIQMYDWMFFLISMEKEHCRLNTSH